MLSVTKEWNFKFYFMVVTSMQPCVASDYGFYGSGTELGYMRSCVRAWGASRAELSSLSPQPLGSFPIFFLHGRGGTERGLTTQKLALTASEQNNLQRILGMLLR